MRHFPSALFACVLLAACGPVPEPSVPVVTEALPPQPAAVRFATYNTSLYDKESGGLIARLTFPTPEVADLEPPDGGNREAA